MTTTEKEQYELILLLSSQLEKMQKTIDELKPERSVTASREFLGF